MTVCRLRSRFTLRQTSTLPNTVSSGNSSSSNVQYRSSSCTHHHQQHNHHLRHHRSRHHLVSNVLIYFVQCVIGFLCGGYNRPHYESCPSVCFLRAPSSKTKWRGKPTQNCCVECSPYRSNRCVNFQIKTSKVRARVQGRC